MRGPFRCRAEARCEQQATGRSEHIGATHIPHRSGGLSLTCAALTTEEVMLAARLGAGSEAGMVLRDASVEAAGDSEPRLTRA